MGKRVQPICVFSQSRVAGFYLLSAVLLGLGVYILLALHVVSLLYFLIPVGWFLVILLMYVKTNTTAIQRNYELYGDNAEVVSEVTDDGIKLSYSNGARHQLYYDRITKGYRTKNYILLRSKANLMYTFRKDGFSVGDEESFVRYMRNKGIVIK